MQRSELKRFEDRKTAALLNHRLAVIQQLLPVLPLNGVELRVVHIHAGPGVWSPRKDNKLHHHPHIQVIHVVHGEPEFVFEQDRVSLKPGQSLTIPPETPHLWRCPHKLVMLGLDMTISGSKRFEFINELAEMQAEGPLVDVGSEADGFSDLFFSLARPEEGLCQMERSAGIFLDWLCALLERVLPLGKWKKVGEQVVAREDHAMALVNQATRFIEENYMKQIQSTDIALHVGVGIRHLNRVFKELTGTSPSKLLQATRLNKAMALLCSHPDYSVKAVAYDCGFRNHSHFTHCFAEVFGVYPSTVQENE